MNNEVRLNPFSDKDIDRLISWIPSEKAMIIWASKTFTYPLRKEALAQHFCSKQAEMLFFKVVNTDNEEVVGHVEFSALDKKEKSATLSRVLVGTEFRGQGFGKSLLKKAIAYAQDELKLRTLNLTVFSFNQKAISLYEYLGFETTGLEKNYIKIEGEFWHRRAMTLQF